MYGRAASALLGRSLKFFPFEQSGTKETQSLSYFLCFHGGGAEIRSPDAPMLFSHSKTGLVQVKATFEQDFIIRAGRARASSAKWSNTNAVKKSEVRGLTLGGVSKKIEKRKRKIVRILQPCCRQIVPAAVQPASTRYKITSNKTPDQTLLLFFQGDNNNTQASQVLETPFLFSRQAKAFRLIPGESH